ncbi:MAG TPA: hypothetical protein VMF60_10790, partial [Acidimicrobiales bacterium]|nr:hypothetical protein [Acidimicrobiales bacterium]
MPAGGDPADEGRDRGSRLTLRQRLLLALPTVGSGKDKADKAPLAERLRDAMVKPVGAEAPSQPATARKPTRAEDIEAELRSATDNERLLGMLAAPFAAVIGFIVANTNPNHVSEGLKHEDELVMLGLSLLILLTAVLRKRLFLAIALALFGLTSFDLHLWGFAIPYILGAAWLLVRSYRLQRELKAAGSATAPRPRAGGKGIPYSARARASKRYTPPTPPKRSPPSKSEKR